MNDNGFKSPEELAKDQIGSFMMQAMKNREQNILELLRGIDAAETMLRGLPNIASVMEELAVLDEEHSTALAQLIEAEEGSDESYDVVSGAQTTLAKGQKNVVNAQVVLAKSVRACAKTQITLARYLKHAMTMLIVYVGSESHTKDAADGALKVGRDDALREFAKQKFGSAFGQNKTADESP